MPGEGQCREPEMEAMLPPNHQGCEVWHASLAWGAHEVVWVQAAGSGGG